MKTNMKNGFHRDCKETWVGMHFGHFWIMKYFLSWTANIWSVWLNFLHIYGKVYLEHTGCGPWMWVSEARTYVAIQHKTEECVICTPTHKAPHHTVVWHVLHSQTNPWTIKSNSVPQLVLFWKDSYYGRQQTFILITGYALKAIRCWL